MLKHSKLKTFFCFIILCMLPNYSVASDYRNIKNPEFINVDRVFIHLVYNLIFFDESNIPEPLQKEMLENTLLKAYQNRFSSKHCKQYLQGKNPYSCNDQPVTLISDEEQTSFLTYGRYPSPQSFQYGAKGDLNVIYRVLIFGNYDNFSSDVKVPIVQIMPYHERPKSNIELGHRIPTALTFSMDKSDEEISKYLEDLFKTLIYR